ncbi:NAD-dependent epimerase/dehydratase family protein [Allostreptomyces psammosilenae]|uniref:Nucleoside-diphosphate-sugar epimerase n=1 Tax=Allostreptomyces psammosilenae TaxID=1892865 RepID=A0A852ZY99_9ACTN|nr:NAD-dependent epimerase/dehydratase family protein [Allostreptomyces psammosilenae]NYI06777.1 nucleoside-diphosphate-sugar epimerase [Allostreptomyces psammosilenae]
MTSPPNGMRVAVVGATGNVGTSVVRALTDDPAIASVLAVARRPPRRADWSPGKTTWLPADITRDHLTGHLDGCDALIHLAWALQPSHDPVATWRNNVLGALHVFRAVAQAGVGALIHASSVGAYSPGPQQRRVDESWPTHGWPKAAYCVEKAYLERALDAFECRHPRIRVVRMRPGFLFKREAARAQARLFAAPALLPHAVLPDALASRLALQRLVPAVPNPPGLRFQALHTDDAAEAYRLATLRPVSGAFNLAAEPAVDADLLGRILRARPLPLPTRPLLAAASAAWHLRLLRASPDLLDAMLRLPLMDASRAGRELGWSPRHTAGEAIEDLLRGLREPPPAPTPALRHAVSPEPWLARP